MSHHDNTAAWAAIIIAAAAHVIIAAAGIHAATTGHAAPIISAFLAGPSIIALTAAALCKAASRPMPAPAANRTHNRIR